MFFFRPTPLTPETTGPGRLGKDCWSLAGVSAFSSAWKRFNIRPPDDGGQHSCPPSPARAWAWILMGRINLIDSSSGGTNSQDVLPETVQRKVMGVMGS